MEEDLVRSDLAEGGFQAQLSDDLLARIIRDGVGSVSPNGILGDARGATATLGRRLMEALAAQVAHVIRSK